MKALLIALVLISSSISFAYDDLFSEQEQQQQAAQAQERASRMAAQNQRLLAGIRAQTRSLGIVDPATAKCSAGWDDRDYQNVASQLCDSQSCFSLYSDSEGSFDGFLFTCHFNLTNGSQCFLEAYSLPHDGFSGRCVDTALKNHSLDINVDAPVTHAKRPIAKKKR